MDPQKHRIWSTDSCVSQLKSFMFWLCVDKLENLSLGSVFCFLAVLHKKACRGGDYSKSYLLAKLFKMFNIYLHFSLNSIFISA